MQLITKYGPLVGRILIGLFLLASALGKYLAFPDFAAYLAGALPMANPVAVFSIALDSVVAIMLIVGWKARLAAFAYVLWTIPFTIIFYPFWSEPAHNRMFFTSLGLMGGMLYVAAHGSGHCSVEKS